MSGCFRNHCPDNPGTGVRMFPEWVSGCFQNLQLDLMEIIEDRHARKSTIIASQLPVASWFDVFSEPTVADSFLDRIVYTAHRFELMGESLRKKR